MFSYPLFRDSLPFSIRDPNDHNEDAYLSNCQHMSFPSLPHLSLKKMFLPLNPFIPVVSKSVHDGPLSKAIDLQMDNIQLRNRVVNGISVLSALNECSSTPDAKSIDAQNAKPNINSHMANSSSGENSLKTTYNKSHQVASKFNKHFRGFNSSHDMVKEELGPPIPLPIIVIMIFIMSVIFYSMAVEQAKLSLDIPPV